jgi:NAD(P)-dependent dehydrogenase (short-subunit alcohol dehydrogenase family)
MDTVLVTGASSGIGLETALHLAERGFRVYGTFLAPGETQAVEAAAHERHVSLGLLQMDVTNPASVDAAFERLFAEAGSLYGLVNNAGLGQRGCFEDLTQQEIRELFDVNVFGVMAATRRALPSMRAAGRGRVITISSVGGRIASFGLSSYCSTKFACEGFGEALALEIAPFGLQSILIEPGIINTPHWSVNRGTGRHALDADSPYTAMFQRHESIADRRTRRSGIRPAHVASVVHHALTARHPRMHYVVGRPASVVVTLRRLLPDRIFERVYFGLLLRQITRGQPRRNSQVGSR